MKEIPELRLLPGALLPGRWLAGMPLDETLPAIRAALAARQLLISELPLPPDAGQDDGSPLVWAHDVWLSRQTGGAQQPAPAAMAALRQLGRIRQAASPDDDRPSQGWLLQPVAFRLTTDRMLLDPAPGRHIDAALAERLVQHIAPVLADAGHAIRILTPDCWLLTPHSGEPGWQLQCTPIETISDRHVDTHLPRGPDARRFRRLLNEIQMTWHQLDQQGPADLPVNGVWLCGPLGADAWQIWQALHAQGLRVDERFLAHRADLDPAGWMRVLPVLDTWYQAAPAQFAVLLAGERRLRWLHAPGALPAALQPAGVRPQPLPASADGSWWQRLRARLGGRLWAPGTASATGAGPSAGRSAPQAGQAHVMPGRSPSHARHADAALFSVFAEDD